MPEVHALPMLQPPGWIEKCEISHIFSHGWYVRNGCWVAA